MWGVDFAWVGEGHVRRTINRLDLFKTLSRIEAVILNVIVSHDCLNLKGLAAGAHFVLDGVWQADGLRGDLISGAAVASVFSPERDVSRSGHGTWDSIFDVVGERLGVNAAELGALALLIDLLAVSGDMGNVLSRLAAVFALSIGEANLHEVLLSPRSTRGNVTVDIFLVGSQTADNLLVVCLHTARLVYRPTHPPTPFF